MLLFRGDSEKVYALLAPPSPKADARAVPMPDIGKLLTVARARSHDAAPRQMVVSNWGRGDARITVSLARPSLVALQDSVVFSATGTVASEEHPAGQAVGKQILGSLGQLHFGWFGGWPIRLVYGLLGAALCVVTVSGIEVWLARRRDKGRGSPLWERVWTMIVWGQPLVLAALLVVGVAGWLTATTALQSWTVATIASLVAGAVIRIPRRRMAGPLKLATALCMIVAAIWRLVSLYDRPDATAAAIGSIALILVASVLLLPLLASKQMWRK